MLILAIVSIIIGVVNLTLGLSTDNQITAFNLVCGGVLIVNGLWLVAMADKLDD